MSTIEYCCIPFGCICTGFVRAGHRLCASDRNPNPASLPSCRTTSNSRTFGSTRDVRELERNSTRNDDEFVVGDGGGGTKVEVEQQQREEVNEPAVLLGCTPSDEETRGEEGQTESTWNGDVVEHDDLSDGSDREGDAHDVNVWVQQSVEEAKKEFILSSNRPDIDTGVVVFVTSTPVHRKTLSDTRRLLHILDVKKVVYTKVRVVIPWMETAFHHSTCPVVAGGGGCGRGPM